MAEDDVLKPTLVVTFEELPQDVREKLVAERAAIVQEVVLFKFRARQHFAAGYTDPKPIFKGITY